MFRAGCLILLLLCATARDARGYGVLAHEAIIDATWDQTIVPVLRAKFHPTDDALRHARAYAYGGSLIQDIGYYPLSSRTFGDLTHYVRSGDFVSALFAEASTLNEYAFALGALAHYVGDNSGHPLAVNPGVALIYPKLRAKYGEQVTYEQNPAAHLKTEFGFDVVQVARGSYASASYHSFVGFEVSRPVLARAFKDTYGLDLQDVFADFDTAVGTFRFTVSTLIPKVTKVAWETRHDAIERLDPAVTRQKFLYGISRTEYEREFGTKYARPGLGSRLLAAVLRIVPKVGPLQGLAFRVPTPEAQTLFIQSFDTTVSQYRHQVDLASRSRLRLKDTNFHTGMPLKPGSYQRADAAYEALVDKLQEHDFRDVTPELRADLVNYFSMPRPAGADKHARKRWAKAQAQIVRSQPLKSKRSASGGSS